MNTTDVYSITAVGTLPSCTLPTLAATVQDEQLTISWSAGNFSAGTLPTKGSKQTVATTVETATTTAPVFSGIATELKAVFTGTDGGDVNG